MPSIVDATISRRLSASACSRLLSGDGISTLDFTVKGIPGILSGISIDSREARKSIPGIGAAMSAAKNLDEYEFKLCELVHSLPDSELKMQLQKYRIGIIASFSKLVELTNARQLEGLARWVQFSTKLLEGVADMFLKATTNPNLQLTTNIAQSLEFYGVSEKKVEDALRSFYGLEPL